MSRSSKPINEVTFTNDKGHVINVGDDVIFVTVSAHNVSVGVGKYLGVRDAETYYGAEHVNVIIASEKTRAVRIDAAGNDIGDDWEKWRIDGYKSRTEAYIGRTTLQNNRVYPINVSLRESFGNS